MSESSEELLVVGEYEAQSGERMTATEKAVKQLKTYARYIYEHAENIVGNIDKPNYVTEGGIRISFTLMEHDSIPVLNVSKEYIVLEAIYDEQSRTQRLVVDQAGQVRP